MLQVVDGLFYSIIMGCGIVALYALGCVSLWLFDRFKDQK